MVALNLSMKSSHLKMKAIAKKLTICPSAGSFSNRAHPEMKIETSKRVRSLIKNNGQPTLLAYNDNALNTFDPTIEWSNNPFGSKNPLKPVNR